MPKTYEGILKGNRISWTKGHPDRRDALRVRVTVVEEGEEREQRGAKMVAALRRIAESGGVADIKQPREWQRGVRSDRELPGRSVE